MCACCRWEPWSGGPPWRTSSQPCPIGSLPHLPGVTTTNTFTSEGRGPAEEPRQLPTAATPALAIRMIAFVMLPVRVRPAQV
ncbi:unnamed protein product [Arctogadus glacialis]